MTQIQDVARSSRSMQLNLGLGWLVATVMVHGPTLLDGPGSLRAQPDVRAYASHPPTRPLPVPAVRKLGGGPARFVDPKSGSDENSGSQAEPYRSVTHGAAQLKPGETLVLRGGIYHEHARIQARGTEQAPITIRSYPGELAIIDGGIPEFLLNPAAAWEPVAGGAKDEYRSINAFPELGGREGSTTVLGNFADSMTPLHGYRFITDLRSDNEYFAEFDGDKTVQGSGIYCGPGAMWDAETGHIHVRLVHTSVKALGDDNYTGETDPRKLPLVLAGFAGGSALELRGAAYLRLQDLAVRGAREATLSIADCDRITLDGVTAYGGSAPLRVTGTIGLRVLNSGIRGIAAPWTFRGHLKYRSIESKLVAASSWQPDGFGNRDFEFAYSEFTDSVDGVFIGNVSQVSFHHNLLDNLSDDGIFLTAGTSYDGSTPGGPVYIHHNLLSRCLTTFAFGVGHGRQKTVATGKQMGAGVWIYRNLFDFRRAVHYQQPARGEEQVSTYGRVAGDHGGPAWEPMYFYHNTFLDVEAPWRNYYASGMGKAMGHGTRRRMLNNIFFQFTGMPGEVLPPVAADFQADGNLHWSPETDAESSAKFLRRFRNSPDFAATQERFTSGWTARDQLADPQFRSLDRNFSTHPDLRLESDSPGLNAGVPLPAEWPDPFRADDAGEPDVGLIPAGADFWAIGMFGRLSINGAQRDKTLWATQLDQTNSGQPWQAALQPREGGPKVAVVEGYPAFDQPLLAYALDGIQAETTVYEREWLPVERYQEYDVVAVVGDLARAKIEPTRYSEADLKTVVAFMEQGGTLLLMRGRADLFNTPAGKRWQVAAFGDSFNRAAVDYELLKPDHGWLAHLDAKQAAAWLNQPGTNPLAVTQGENLIGGRDKSILARIPIGKGALIYVGWDISRSLPNGRQTSTVADEQKYEQQMAILLGIVRSLRTTGK